MNVITLPAFACAALLALAGCGPGEYREELLERYPLDDIKAVPRQPQVAFDSRVSSDGKGSLRVDAKRTARVALAHTGDLDLEDVVLIYRAKLRTEGVAGRAYLELAIEAPEFGERFSRNLDSAPTGTTDWAEQETRFALESGWNPRDIKFNLVLEGGGRVWIDDIRLFAANR